MSDSNRDRKLKWREACDGGAFWWITGDPDSDVMLSEDEHFAVAAAFEEAADMVRAHRRFDKILIGLFTAKAKEVRDE